MLQGRFNLQWNLCASWFAHLVNLAIGFFLMPYVVHTLGDVKYGSWVFINSIASYSGLLYLGFGDTIGRYVARYHTRKEWQNLNEIVTLILAIYLGMGTIALSAAGVFSLIVPSLNLCNPAELGEIRMVILLLGLNIAISLSGSVFGGILFGLRRFDLERGVALVADFVRLILIFTFLRREWGLVTIATIYLAITIAENLAFIALAFRLVPNLSIHFRHLKLSVLRECYSFSGFAFLNSLASQLIYATDTVVIGVMLGAEAVVPYYIALRLSQFIRQPLQKISEICMPTAGALSATAEHDAVERLVVKAMGMSLLLIGGTFIGTVYFGDLLISTWMGPQYAESYQLLLVLVGMLVVALPVSVLRSVLFGTGHVRGPALIYLAEAVANLVLSLILCRPLGLLGIALGTAIPILLFEIGLIVPYALRIMRISFARILRDAVLPQVLPLCGLLCYAAAVRSMTGLQASWFALLEIALGGGAVLAAGWMMCYCLERTFSWTKSATAG